MDQQVLIASLKVSEYRQDFKSKSGTDLEIFKLLSREFELKSIFEWITEENIKLEFGTYKEFVTYCVIYRMWARMTPEQAVYFKLTYGPGHKEILL